MIDKYVQNMESNDITEKGPSAWGSPVCVVAKADGCPWFCTNYNNNNYKLLARETWSMTDIESPINTFDGAKFITLCDVQSVYWQIPIAKMTVIKRHS